jgi:hypothetical protein
MLLEISFIFPANYTQNEPIRSLWKTGIWWCCFVISFFVMLVFLSLPRSRPDTGSCVESGSKAWKGREGNPLAFVQDSIPDHRLPYCRHHLALVHLSVKNVHPRPGPPTQPYGRPPHTRGWNARLPHNPESNRVLSGGA